MQLSTESRLKAIIDGTRAGTWEWNLDTDEVILNERWCGMLGYSLGELEPVSLETWRSLCHPEDLKRSDATISDYLNGRTAHYECLCRMRHKDGSWRWIHDRGMLMGDFKGNRSRWLVGTHLDVTVEHESRYHLDKLAESLPGVIYSFVHEPDGTTYFTYASERTRDFYGLTPEEVLANPQAVFDVIVPEDLPRVQRSIQLSRNTLARWKCQYRVRVDGRTSWMEGVAQPERDGDGRVTWHGMVVNIDERKSLELELERLSVTDELTGLRNRRFMIRRLDEFAESYKRYGTAFAIASFDIDYFKAINDRFGHLVGDRVLEKFGALIRQRIRKTDFAARMGGEEFLLLMPNTAPESALGVAESLRAVFETEIFESDAGEAFQVTISAGIVPVIKGEWTVRDLLAICDQSLYQAKHDGRNRIVTGTIEPNGQDRTAISTNQTG